MAKATTQPQFALCGPEYDGVLEDHEIELSTYTDWVNMFYKPPAPASPNRNLTGEILAVINNAETLCGDFLHFSGNPFLQNNEDITLGAFTDVSQNYCINYSVALFRALQAKYENCEFEFTKADANVTASGRISLFKIIFCVTQDNILVYCGDMSSGIPY